MLERIDEGKGRYHLLPLRKLSGGRRGEACRRCSSTRPPKHYAEIIENCEVNFVKEIEFENFRKNFTYEEAEEIRMEYEKICTWFDRVQGRDWFDAPNRDEARDVATTLRVDARGVRGEGLRTERHRRRRAPLGARRGRRFASRDRRLM